MTPPYPNNDPRSSANAAASAVESETAGAISSDPNLGRVIGSYRITSVIARGSLGSLYAAQDQAANEQVALKLLDSRLSHSPAFMAAFQQMAESAHHFNHEHAIRVTEVGYNPCYLVMPYVKGVTLLKVLQRKRTLPVDQALKLVLAGLNALSAAHALNLTHGDISPESLIIDASGQVRLTGFGLPRLPEFRQTRFTPTELDEGRPQYIAPELFEDAYADPRSDGYAMGVILFRCATGEFPYPRCSPMELVRYYAQREPEVPHYLNPSVPEPLSQVIMKMIAKHPLQRFQDVASSSRALLQELQALGGRPPSFATPGGGIPAPHLPARGAGVPPPHQPMHPTPVTSPAHLVRTADVPLTESQIETAPRIQAPGQADSAYVQGAGSGSNIQRAPASPSGSNFSKPGYRTVSGDMTKPVAKGLRPPSTGNLQVSPAASRGRMSASHRASRRAGRGRSATTNPAQPLVFVPDVDAVDAPMSDTEARLLAAPGGRNLVPLIVVGGVAVAIVLFVVMLVVFLGGSGQPQQSNNTTTAAENDNGNRNNNAPAPVDTLRTRVEAFVANAQRIERTESSTIEHSREAHQVYLSGLALWDEYPRDRLEDLAKQLGSKGFRYMLGVTADAASWYFFRDTDGRLSKLEAAGDFENAVVLLERLDGWDEELKRPENPAYVLMQNRLNAQRTRIAEEEDRAKAERLHKRCLTLLTDLQSYADSIPGDVLDTAVAYIEGCYNQAKDEDWPQLPQFRDRYGDVGLILFESQFADWNERIVDGELETKLAALAELEAFARRFAGTEAADEAVLWHFMWKRDHVGGDKINLVMVVGLGEFRDNRDGSYLVKGPILVQFSRMTGPGPGAGGTFEVQIKSGDPNDNGRAMRFLPFGNVQRAFAEGIDPYSLPAFYFNDTVSGWNKVSWSVDGNTCFMFTQNNPDLVDLATMFDVNIEPGTGYFFVHDQSTVEIRNVTWVEKLDIQPD